MQTSENGISFIKENEGFIAKISDDVGHPVIGHGHDLTQEEIANGTFKDGIDLPGADILLRTDLTNRFDPVLLEFLPATANQNQIDACSDFLYNDGAANFAVMVHHGFDQIPVQMPAWHWAHVNGVLTSLPGLVERRAKEVALFNTPV
jgi:GH24 family phage-related lysozyme (muramidase)